MTDFDSTQWADFVRGVADPQQQDKMQDQLAAGSAPRRMVEMLRRVAAVGRRDAENPVPASAVRIAKAIGTTARTMTRPEVRRVPCWLAFDSLLEPIAAGARGFQEAHRELTFEANGYSIDLRLEHELQPQGEGPAAAAARRVVVGQLLKLDRFEVLADNLPAPVSRAPVFMFSGERLVGKALTGRHGEFQVEGPPRTSLDLCILAGEDYLEMPLSHGPVGQSEEEES